MIKQAAKLALVVLGAAAVSACVEENYEYGTYQHYSNAAPPSTTAYYPKKKHHHHSSGSYQTGSSGSYQSGSDNTAPPSTTGSSQVGPGMAPPSTTAY